MGTIDSHSHIGYENDEEIVGKNIMMPLMPNIEEYESLAYKNLIDTVLFAPCTSPMIINKKNHITEIYCLWEYIDNKFNYYSETIKDGRIEKKGPIINPYKDINGKLLKYLNELKTNLKIYYIPAIHLYLDTLDYIEELISTNPRGLKVHGISTGLYDLSKINSEILKLISKSNIPLVIHTDYIEHITSSIDILYKENDPLNWIKILDKYDIRGYLTHGCRLSKECSAILKNSKEQFLVGIAPDILLNNEPNRLIERKEDYLKELLYLFDIDTIAFDLDYNWNYTDRISYTFDDNQLVRLREYVNDDTKLKKIVRKNAKKFFGI